MDFIQNISPYWCTDPRLAAARLTQTTKQFLDVDEADPAVVVGGPDALLPVPTPAAYIRERKRMSVLFQLPFPYLPECIFQRGIHETIGDWRVRLTIALDMLGAIKYDDDGVPCYGALDGMPVTTDDLVKACIGFDGGEPFTYLETCDSVCEQVGRVWPGGYPLDDMEKDAYVIHAHCVRGSLVLSAQTAVAFGSTPDCMDVAEDILTRIRIGYGGLFDPDGTGIVDVDRWVLAHRNWALDMASLLGDAGLEDPRLRDDIERVLS